MTYTEPHMVLQWTAGFREGDQASPLKEIAVGSLRFVGPGIDASNNRQTCGALALALQRFWKSTTAQIPQGCYLENVKWNKINVDGRYINQNTIYVNPTGIDGTGGRANYPLQVAWATTWTTDVVRGKASTGRTFWPTSATLDGARSQVAQSATLAMATAAAKLLRDLTYAARTGNVDPTVSPVPTWLQETGFAPTEVREGSGVSPAVMSKIGSGTTRVITGVSVGSRLDIQRRRGEGQIETRQVVPLATPAP